MKSVINCCATYFAGLFACIAQPLTNSASIANLDFDRNGRSDVEYGVAATLTGTVPENWQVGFGISPSRSSRFLRATNARMQFNHGETIGESRRSLTNYLPNPPREPTESYGIGLLFYRATKLGDDWLYSTRAPGFESESQLLLGLKLSLATGTHYGWILLNRAAVDSHTQFELVDYTFHPVPNEAIAAGEFPDLPPIQSLASANGLILFWDTHWGSLVLEATTNLAAPISWESVIEGSGAPVGLPTTEDQRFYRLR